MALTLHWANFVHRNNTFTNFWGILLAVSCVDDLASGKLLCAITALADCFLVLDTGQLLPTGTALLPVSGVHVA